MAGISIRTVLIGNLLNLAIVFLGAVIVIFIAATFSIQPGESFAHAVHAIGHKAWLEDVVSLLIIEGTIAVGYFVARLVDKALVLNAALSTLLPLLLNFVGADSSSAGNLFVNIASMGLPVFAAAGGVVAWLQFRGGALPISAGIALRLAISTILGVLVGLVTLLVTAIAHQVITLLPLTIIAGIFAGYASAPSGKRTTAAVMVFGFALLAATLVAFGAALTGTIKFLHFYVIVLVVMAAFLGRPFFQRRYDAAR